MSSLTSIFPNGFAVATESQDLVSPIDGFTKHCEAQGLVIRDLIADGEIHRVPHISSKKGAVDGWYILHLSGKIPVGVCGCWKEPSFESKWVADTGRAMTFSERLEHDKLIAEIRAKREADRLASQQVAAEKAEDEVGTYADASADHPYLVRKRIEPHGIKIDRAGRLVVPVIDQEGEILSYQTIDADGNKRFLKGGKIEGGFYELRGNRKVIFIGEGFATCASIHQATGFTTLVAFDCGNLAKVAKSAKEMFLGSRIVICADNDQFTEGNPGITKAKAAAGLVFGEIVYPIFNESDLASKPTDFNDLHTLQGIEAVKEQIERVALPAIDKLAFEFSRADSLELTEIKWVVDDYIEADSLAQVFGDPGGGKSFVAIDLACCVATGKPWHGHDVKQGSVFYIAGEGHNGLARRLKAWQIGNGTSLAGVPLYKSHRAAQLYDATEAAVVAEAIKQLSAEANCIPSMIVIDTLARNHGGDENSTQDMNAFIQHLDVYLRQPWKCCVMVVHHSGVADKDRSRGSTALKGALDAEYKCQLDSGTKTIAFESKKMKDAEMPSPKNFQITQVDLPINNKNGMPVKGAYLTAVDISGLVSQVQKKTYLSPNQKQVMECLVMLEVSLFQNHQLRPVGYDEWRDSAKEHGVKNNRFWEVVKSMIAKDMILEVDGGYRSHPKPSETHPNRIISDGK
jgi:putative DNA primase/helicase